MTVKKAQKHLAFNRQHLVWLRERYVEVMRSPYWRGLNRMSVLGENYFQKEVDDIRRDMNTVKERIARYERIVK